MGFKLDLRSKISGTTGQVMLVTLMLGLVLAVGVTLVLFLNENTTRAQAGQTRRGKARDAARSAIAEVARQLSASQTVWTNALAGDFSPTACNSGSLISMPSGDRVKLICSAGVGTAPKLQKYQVAVTAQGYDAQGVNPLRSVRAYLSPRTLGTDLATGVHAAAALQLVRQPVIPTGAQLNVHWGPVVCMDDGSGTSWTLPEPMESQRYPRKFSEGGLTGPNFPRSGATTGAGPATDNREYYASLTHSFVPLINETSYQQSAAVSYIPTPPKLKNTPGTDVPVGVCSGGLTQCGIFTVPDPTDAAVFDNGFVPPAGAVIYVDGSAEFDNITADSVTFIVTGNLTINGGSAGQDRFLHVPVTAPQEYPYAPVTPTVWPCSDKAGNMTGNVPAYDCASTDVFPGLVHFRGFLYVKGNLIVNTANWNMVGALMVGDPLSTTGGTLSITPGSRLNLAYDDYINHAILVNPVGVSQIRIVPDIEEDVRSN